MSSYLGNLLTQTTSHYKQIRRTLLSNEEDGDTEDDSHISRVLRAYYTEKGRPFPPWLPPDPNERKSIPPQAYLQQAQSSYFSNNSSRPAMATAQSQMSNSGRSSLSDLWDPPSQGGGPMQPQSLRNTRRPGAPAMPSSNAANSLAPVPQARPLPSQRAGSYQNMQAQVPSRPPLEPTPPSSSGGGSTAQDRLKARLWGGSGSGRASSPANAGNGGYPPPSNAANPYGSGGGYGR